MYQSSPAAVTASAPVTRLDSALFMASLGLSVFPLRPGTKQPYRGEGHAAASADPEVIRGWFLTRPGMNYACLTTDFVVLDVDVKHGAPGLRSLETLGALPYTLQVQTPSGGLHIYFGLYHTGQADIAPGINVRGHNGYVVGPGCKLDGLEDEYRISVLAPIAPTPAHIALKLKPPGHRKDTATGATAELDTDEAIARAGAFLESRDGNLRGGRNNSAYATAAKLREYGVSEDKAFELLRDRWNNRNEPPLPAFELAEVTRNAFAYAQNAAGVLTAEAEFEAIPDDALPDAARDAPAPAEDAPRQWFKPLQVVRDPVLHPRRPWLVHNTLLRGHLTGMISPGGVGKSSLALGLALGVAMGDTSALGFTTPAGFTGADVIVISTEDDDAEIWGRVWGHCTRHNIPLSSIEGRVHIFDGGDVPFKSVARDRQSKQLHRTKMLQTLGSYAESVRAGLIVIDPLVETHDAAENDNGEVAIVMSAMRSVCRTVGAAGLVVHHSRKIGPMDSISPDNAARGAGALVNGFRLNFMLSRPSADDAAEMGLSEAEAAPMFRLDKGKGNYVPPGRDTKWFRTVGLQMPNGDLETGEPGTVTHSVEAFDPEPARAKMRQAVHSLLRDVIEAAGGQIAFAEGVRALASDPVLGGEEKATRDRLEAMLGAAGYCFDGYTVRLVVENPEAVRPRKVLRGE